MIKKTLNCLTKTPSCGAAIVVFASFGILGTALISQYVFGLKPCQLCIYQRIPYVITIAFGLIAYGTSRHALRASALFMGLSAITFAVGAGIAGFHVGVEQEWWAGLDSCGASAGSENMSIEELRQMVLSAPVTKCSEIAWSLFGISMAGYNVLASFALMVFSLISLTKTVKIIKG